MGLSLTTVTTRTDWRDFHALADEVYRGDPHWVAPLRALVRESLDPARNPYFRRAALRVVLARRGGHPAARAVFVVDPASEPARGRRCATFGFFEALSDAPAARAVLDDGFAWARGRGAVRIDGPMNPNPYSELGLRLSHFDRDPLFFETWNPPRYAALLEEAGLSVAARLHTAVNARAAATVHERYGPGPWASASGGYVARPLSRRDRAGDLERIREVFNAAFAVNLGFVPLSKEEYAFSAQGLSYVTDEDLVWLVEHRGAPVAALICERDVNPWLKPLRGRRTPWGLVSFLARRRSARRVILHSVGVVPRHRGSRAFALLVHAACTVLSRFESAATTWMSPDNAASVGAAERLGLEPEARFALYGRDLP